MARKKSQNSVSLFPFLAVLVCTMGALILLLLLTTRRIQKQQDEGLVAAEVADDASEALDIIELDASFNLTSADDQKPAAVPGNSAPDQLPLTLPDPFASPFASPFADAEPHAESIAALKDTPDLNTLTIPEFNDADEEANNPLTLPEPARKTNFELQLEIDELTATLDKETAEHKQLLKDIAAVEELLAANTGDDMDIQMDQLSSLKRQEEVLKSQLEDQQLALNELNKRLDVASRTTEEAENILQARESALISLRKITQENTDLSVAGSDKTLLEFSNSSGTSRRPIVVEVAGDGFRFQPANVMITADQMEGFPQNDNPLLAGIAASHEHASANGLSVSPYVLLLVRPNGSLAFYAAQRTLKNANIHFGYELVDQSQNVVTGKMDLRERDAIRSAVATALTRQQKLYSGLLAQLQDLQPSQNKQPSQQPRLLPDGRIAMPGESGHDSFGQYFVGGTPPPESVGLQNRLEAARQQQAVQDRWPQIADAANAVEANSDTMGQSTDGQSAVSELLPSTNDSQFNPFNLKDGVGGDEFADNGTGSGSATESSPWPQQPDPAAELQQQLAASELPGDGDWLSGMKNDSDSTEIGFGGPSHDELSEAGPSSILESMLNSAQQQQPNKPAAVLPQLSPEEVRRAEEVKRLNQLAGNFGLGNFNNQGDTTNQGNSASQGIAANPLAASPSAGQPRSIASQQAPAGQSSDTSFWANQFVDAGTPGSATNAAEGASVPPSFGPESSANASSDIAPKPTDLHASVIQEDDFNTAISEAFDEEMPDRINLSWLQESSPIPQPESPNSNSNPGSQLTPDWSESATAPADSTTRTVGAPENPFTVEAAEGQRASDQFSAGMQGGMGGEASASVEPSATDNAISEFLRSIDAELDASRPDPFLLTLLDSANSTQDGKFAGRHPVTIVMNGDLMKVGGSPPINLQALSQQQVVDATLNALAVEMDSKPAQNGRFALPFVDWKVDSSSRQRQANLQKLLERMDVPTRSITPGARAEQPDVPVLNWPGFGQPAPLRESADPIQITPPARSERGLSL